MMPGPPSTGMMVGGVVARKEARMRWRLPGKERAREKTSRIVSGDERRFSVYYYYCYLVPKR